MFIVHAGVSVNSFQECCSKTLIMFIVATQSSVLLCTYDRFGYRWPYMYPGVKTVAYVLGKEVSLPTEKC